MRLFRSGYLPAHTLVISLVISLVFGPAQAEEINVAVASNFTSAMKEITAEFEKSSGDRVKLSFGSSGRFFAQIKNGAPFQVFLSADQAKPLALERAGLTVPNSRFTYAVGALALWSSQPGFVDNNATRLKNGHFNRVALANPKLAPYGLAAVEVLEKLRVKEATVSKWIQGENISQTYQFVSSGNADLGFVALSQIMVEGRIRSGSAWVIPAGLYQPIRQDAVLLNAGRDSAAALALLQFLSSGRGREIIESHGYTTTSASP